MVSRQETARPLLTPGEVMQLPADEEIVMVSGQPPIRARKLRYYEDANFTGRVCPPPASWVEGRWTDCPPSRPNDWGDQVRVPHARLADDEADTLALSEDEDDGGLKRHPQLMEAAERTPETERAPDAGLLDDDFDDVDGERLKWTSRDAALRRAHAMNAGADERADDDLLPKF